MRDLHIPISRRGLLSSAAVATGMALLNVGDAVANEEINFQSPGEIIDTNVSLFHYPFRRLPLDSTDRLVAKLRELNISQAWAGSYEGIFHRDLTAVNQRLADECSKFAELIPFGTVNPTLPGWEADFDLCHRKHSMPGIRLYPGYHQYQLDDDNCMSLMALAREAGIVIQIVTTLEDMRTQHRLVQIPDVDLKPLIQVFDKIGRPKIQILNMRMNLGLFQQLSPFENISFDTSRIDGTDGVKTLFGVIPPHRVCFGTHAPFLIPEAALIRVIEAPLSVVEREHLVSLSTQKLIWGE